MMTTTTITASTVNSAAPTLSFPETEALVLIVAAGMLAAGTIVIVGRKLITSDGGSPSLIRSWVAISLVLGLLLFCATAFVITDESLRSTLFGGLIASVGAAVAFYFSSQSADQARADILAAATTFAQGGTPPTGFSAVAPPPGRVGYLYSYTFKANGAPTPKYTAIGGSVPDGLLLGADGVLEGTPTASGLYTFALRATNPAGSVTSADVSLVIAA